LPAPKGTLLFLRTIPLLERKESWGSVQKSPVPFDAERENRTRIALARGGLSSRKDEKTAKTRHRGREPRRKIPENDQAQVLGDKECNPNVRGNAGRPKRWKGSQR